MARKKDSENPFERLRAAIDEWLEAFDAESTELVRAELAQIQETDTTEAILHRLDKALEFLDGDAARLHDRAEEEHRTAANLERDALAAISAGDDDSAREALALQNDHLLLATRYLDNALQLKWMLNQYRSTVAAMQRTR